MQGDRMDYAVLVNKDNIIDKKTIDEFKKVKTLNIYGEEVLVEENTLKNFTKLKEELEKENIFIQIDSAYRSLEEQNKIIEEFTYKYGKEYTMKTVAKVGTSEHHTGLALDLCLIVDGIKIIENEDLIKYEEIWKIIHKKIHKYGFILRYQKGKENITGYSYEPWHIRYVGNIAKNIYENNLSLEEYKKRIND